MPKFTKHAKASRVLGKSASDGKAVRGILKERNQSGSQTQNKDAAEMKDEGNGTIEWSDWLWDERSQIYYRAKKDPENLKLWLYEYAEVENYLMAKENYIPTYCKYPELGFPSTDAKIAFQDPPKYLLKEKEGEYVLAVSKEVQTPLVDGNLEVKKGVEDAPRADGQKVAGTSQSQAEDKAEGKSDAVDRTEERDAETKITKPKHSRRQRGRSREPKKIGD